VQDLLRETNGQAEYKHPNGVLSIVNTAMGTKRVRIANLPPEVKEHAIRTTLAPLGTILAVLAFILRHLTFIRRTHPILLNRYLTNAPNGCAAAI